MMLTVKVVRYHRFVLSGEQNRSKKILINTRFKKEKLIMSNESKNIVTTEDLFKVLFGEEKYNEIKVRAENAAKEACEDDEDE